MIGYAEGRPDDRFGVCRERAVVALVVVPAFRGEEDVPARDARLREGLPDALLAARIREAIATVVQEGKVRWIGVGYSGLALLVVVTVPLLILAGLALQQLFVRCRRTARHRVRTDAAQDAERQDHAPAAQGARTGLARGRHLDTGSRELT